MDIVSSVKRLGFSFELRPSEGNSYHVPKEWRSGASKDLVAIEVSGNVNRMIDTFVHELGHVEFTPRDKLYKKLLGKYRYICNLVEDVRVEHLIRQKYGWTFKTWTYPRISYSERFHGRNLIALMIWLYVKKIANSRGEEVPREYAQFVVARAG
ncbi:MAG: hypothetical protein N2504_07740, partial [candidate division WOR-3 bacterium]|nr:hypothetical protein [candidate division WOR-3 bacterium]